MIKLPTKKKQAGSNLYTKLVSPSSLFSPCLPLSPFDREIEQKLKHFGENEGPHTRHLVCCWFWMRGDWIRAMLPKNVAKKSDRVTCHAIF